MKATARIGRSGVMVIAVALFAPFGVASAAGATDWVDLPPMACGELPNYACHTPSAQAPETGPAMVAASKGVHGLLDTEQGDATQSRGTSDVTAGCGDLPNYLCLIRP